MSRRTYLDFQRSNADDFAYEQANPIEPPDSRSRKSISTGAIIAIIIVIIIIIAVIIIVIILIRRRATTTNGGGTPTPTPPVIQEICDTDADCQFPKVCKESLGLCVECMDDTSCGSVFSKCRTDVNKCVKCLADSDCSGPEICSEYKCCDQSAPIITNITTRSWNQAPIGVTALDIYYTNFQGNGALKAYLFIEEPATGIPLLTTSCLDKPDKTCANSSVCPPGDICELSKCSIPNCHTSDVRSTFLVDSSLVDLKLFRGFPYNFKIRLLYTCGGLVNKITPYSNTFTYIPNFCFGLVLAPNIVAVKDGNTVPININVGLGLMLIYTDTNDSLLKVGILVTRTPNRHPELDEIYYQNDTPFANNFNNGDPMYPNSRYFAIPQTVLGNLTGTWYFRIVSVPTSPMLNGCLSFISNQFQFTF